MTLFNLPTNSASVAVGGTGDAVAVWLNEGTGAVQYSRRTGGVWAAGKALYTPAAAKGELAGDPQVVLQPDGTAVALFWSTTPGPLQYCNSGGRIVRCYGPNKSYAKAATLAPGAAAWVRVNVSVSS